METLYSLSLWPTFRKDQPKPKWALDLGPSNLYNSHIVALQSWIRSLTWDAILRLSQTQNIDVPLKVSALKCFKFGTSYNLMVGTGEVLTLKWVEEASESCQACHFTVTWVWGPTWGGWTLEIGWDCYYCTSLPVMQLLPCPLFLWFGSGAPQLIFSGDYKVWPLWQPWIWISIFWS